MVVKQMPLKVQVEGHTHVGRIRQNNEDVWGQLPDENFIVLADGMGGHQAGEVAAKEAVNYLCRVFKKALQDDELRKDPTKLSKTLEQAIIHTNARVYQMSRELEGLKGMGTTLCSLWLDEGYVIIAHVGDSRIYRLRNRRLKLLTKDHSLLRELMDMGQVTEQQAGEFLYKNIITKAIGTEPMVEPTVEILPLNPGDLFLLCSDGLSDHVSQPEIEAVLNRSRSAPLAARELVALANAKGGHDNITVVVAKASK